MGKQSQHIAEVLACLESDREDTIKSVYSFCKYLLSTYYVPGIVYGSGDTNENQSWLVLACHIPRV